MPKLNVDAKMAKVVAKGIFPDAAKPAAVFIIFASATPILKNRSGNTLANSIALVEPAKSAERTTTLGLLLPNSTKAFPQASRVHFNSTIHY